MGEQQRLLEQTLNLVSTPAADALGTPGMVPQDGRCAGNCVRDWTLARSPLLLSIANRGHHGLTNPRRTAFHPTDASPSLLETRSTYYLLLLKLLLPAKGSTHANARGANRLSGLTEGIYCQCKGIRKLLLFLFTNTCTYYSCVLRSHRKYLLPV